MVGVGRQSPMSMSPLPFGMRCWSPVPGMSPNASQTRMMVPRPHYSPMTTVSLCLESLFDFFCVKMNIGRVGIRGSAVDVRIFDVRVNSGFYPLHPPTQNSTRLLSFLNYRRQKRWH